MLYQVQFISRLIGLVWCKNDLMTFFSTTWCDFIAASAIKTFRFMLRGIWGSSSIKLLEGLFYYFFFCHAWHWLYKSRFLFTHTAFSHFDKKTARFSMIRCHLVFHLWYQIIDPNRCTTILLLCFYLFFQELIHSRFRCKLLLRAKCLVEIFWVVMILWFTLYRILIKREFRLIWIDFE